MTHAATDLIPERDARRTAALLEVIFPPPRRFGIRLWEGSELPHEGQPTFQLVLNHPGALHRMFKPPIELSLGEAFIWNDFDIEGDIFISCYRLIIRYRNIIKGNSDGYIRGKVIFIQHHTVEGVSSG